MEIILPRLNKLTKKQKMARGRLAAEWEALTSEVNRISALPVKDHCESEPGAKQSAKIKDMKLRVTKISKRMRKITDEINALEKEGSRPKRRGGGKKEDPFVLVRDLFIRRLEDESDKRICSILDQVLRPRDLTPIGLPENWTEKHGVKSYTEAYMHLKCRSLVNTMISKARKTF